MVTKETLTEALFPFKHVAFSIIRLEKVDLNDLLAPEVSQIKLTAEKEFKVEVNSDDTAKIRVLASMRAYVSDEEESGGEKSPKDCPIISIDTVSVYLLTSTSPTPDVDVIVQNLIVAQANIHMTDVVNSIMDNSELRGDKVPYDI